MTYTFDTEPNSYLNGQDVRVSNGTDNILVNIKDGMWAVNVKDTIRAEIPADVRTALGVLSEGMCELVYEDGKRDFWMGADALAEEYGFDKVYQAGRSGGWLCVEETKDWPPEALFNEPDDEGVQNFLKLAFGTIDLIEGARSHYYTRVREFMAEIQIELLEYSEWVGAKVRGLDGSKSTIGYLGVFQGRAIFREGAETEGFSFANEVTLIDKADSELPFTNCPNCGKAVPNAEPGHETSCVLGALLTVIEDRDDLDLSAVDISTINSDWLWAQLGPLADQIEHELKQNAE